VAAWDIDVRPDFKGLPKGSGSVAAGMDIWEAQCASCHGVFGESNSVFSPLVGGTTARDIETGIVARLTDESYPGRTTLMKVSQLSTLWDYINRAMPWTNPKSLKPDEVYAVTAYLLNLGGIVPDNFVLSDQNMAQTQARMPNRNGMTTAHAMWPGNEFGGSRKPDVQGTRCMSNCVAEPKVASFLPDFARNAHGNLAEQNRPVGAQVGADTSRPEDKSSSPRSSAPSGSSGSAGSSAKATPAAPAPAGAVVAAVPTPTPAPGSPAASGAAVLDSKAAMALANKHTCTACHAANAKLLGPSFTDIAKKYPGNVDYIATKIKAGGSGVWGPIPMPAQSLPVADARALAAWLAAGAK
jgi:cytochrome c